MTAIGGSRGYFWLGYGMGNGMRNSERKSGKILRKKHIAAIVLVLLFLILMLPGCSRWLAGYGIVPDNESPRQIKEYEKKGEEIMTEYLAANFPDAEITWCNCWTVYGDAKSYLTDYVRGTFQIGEDSYGYYVNVYTGDVYTGYYSEEIVNRIYPQICEKLGIENYMIKHKSIGKRVHATENENLDSYELDKALLIPVPGDVHEDELDEFIAEIFSGNGYRLDCTIVYDDDIRIEDMDFDQLSEEFGGVDFFLYHRQKGADLNLGTEIGHLESLYFVMDREYRYSSYNIVEQGNIFLVYRECSSMGDGDVQIDTADKIEPDNFSIKKDDEKIEVQLKEPARYYLCFSDTGFLGMEGLYYYRDEAGRYVKADMKEDGGMGYYAVYARGAGPSYYEKSTTFYIGMPSSEENN